MNLIVKVETLGKECGHPIQRVDDKHVYELTKEDLDLLLHPNKNEAEKK